MWTPKVDKVQGLLDRLQEFSAKTLPVAQRVPWLKFFKQYDIDDWKRAIMKQIPELHRKKTCCICHSEDPLYYPHGILGDAFCSGHYELTPDDFLKGDVALRCGAEETEKSLPDLCSTHNFPISTRPCSLCDGRQATIRHWTDECPVIHAGCKIIGSPGLRHAFVPNCNKIAFVRTVCMLHQVRLLLCRDGNLSLEPMRRTGSRSPTHALNQLLEAYHKYAHPSCLTPNIVKAASEGYKPQDSKKINFGLFRAPAPWEGPFVQARGLYSSQPSRLNLGPPVHGSEWVRLNSKTWGPGNGACGTGGRPQPQRALETGRRGKRQQHLLAHSR